MLRSWETAAKAGPGSIPRARANISEAAEATPSKKNLLQNLVISDIQLPWRTPTSAVKTDPFKKESTAAEAGQGNDIQLPDTGATEAVNMGPFKNELLY